MDPEKNKEEAIVTPPVVKVEEVAKVETPVAETPKKDESADASVVTPKPIVRAEGEDATRFNLRQQLKVAQQSFVTAESEDDKSLFKNEMKKIRTQLYQHSVTANPTETKLGETIVVQPTEDEETAIKANLKKLGYVGKDEVLAEARKMVTEELSRKDAVKNEDAHATVINDFYASRPDIASDNDLKQGLEAYVIQNFKVTPLTPPELLAQYLKMAAAFFVPSATPQKDDDAKNAQDKVDLLNISGGNSTVSKTIDASRKEEVAHLKSLGWSDARIESFYK